MMIKQNGNIKLNKHEELAYRNVVLCNMATPGQRYLVKTMLDKIDFMILSAPNRHKDGIPICTSTGEVLEVRRA